MGTRRSYAIELLMSFPEAVVAEMLGLKLCTLRRWMRDDRFAEALREREREQAASLARLSRQAAVNAAAVLCQVFSGGCKADPKVVLETLKVSGAFDIPQEDPARALADMIKKAADLDKEVVPDAQ